MAATDIKKQNKSQSSSLMRKNMRKLLNNRLAMLGAIIVLLYLILCIFAPVFTRESPIDPNFSGKEIAPNGQHIFGTDQLGRDQFSRILYGGRASIFIGVFCSVIGSLIGMVLGAIAGYFGGWIDAGLIRLSEIFLTFPQMILVMLLVTMLGQNLTNLILVFSLTGWMTVFRVVRNEFLSLKEETYVKACEAFGMKKSAIMFKQILPNIISPIIVATTVNIAGYILSEAGLSFLGVGVPSSTPTWGNMLNSAKSIHIIDTYWWYWVIPGLAISIFVLAINFFGDGLRDVLDPKQQ